MRWFVNSKANKISSHFISSGLVPLLPKLRHLGYLCWLANSDGKGSISSSWSRARHLLFSQLFPARRNGWQSSGKLSCDVPKDFFLLNVICRNYLWSEDTSIEVGQRIQGQWKWDWWKLDWQQDCIKIALSEVWIQLIYIFLDCLNCCT